MPTHQPGESLGAGRAGKHTDGGFEQCEHGPPARGERHVARRHEFHPGAGRPALDDRDRRLRHRAQTLEEILQQSKSDRFRRYALARRQEQRQIGMAEKEVGTGAAEQDHPHAAVGAQKIQQRAALADHGLVEQVHRRVVEHHPENRAFRTRRNRVYCRSGTLAPSLVGLAGWACLRFQSTSIATGWKRAKVPCAA